MENSHVHVMRPAPAGPVVPARSPNAWIAPTVATVLSFFLTSLGMFAIGFAVMATDSCGPDDCSSDITVPLSLMAYGLYAAPFITPPALITAWALPWRPRWTTARRWAAAIAVLPGLMAVGGLALLLTLGG
ncbi:MULTISPECIES: hypothetical protein [unclassified Streptomyces]|uniref:hypothetical protein n=1 Tax=unclassified Streptomyces TaxID=2593676 RepID=UPI00225B43C6|nr:MULTISPECIES: hypothetical protein [unclassified Streptomyces]WSP56643.1 hypothetical protein OG306_21440 [Streptomyces sp. NBC_01241]WSU22639.1 hypothetical protein OG508_17790 [Streptomyces sp. NBC_01108]MCX4788390.1 hypothetical protein [Streptomyces sp. NBC_01221]MCX4795849.1 hypothetical protein [Streptomyces sp. NBC_01242]WSJ37131.1 hypothetical protein OG772_14495 [Streptomyces sp. NBC_01321]